MWFGHCSQIFEWCGSWVVYETWLCFMNSLFVLDSLGGFGDTACRWCPFMRSWWLWELVVRSILWHYHYYWWHSILIVVLLWCLWHWTIHQMLLPPLVCRAISVLKNSVLQKRSEISAWGLYLGMWMSNFWWVMKKLFLDKDWETSTDCFCSRMNYS